MEEDASHAPCPGEGEELRNLAASPFASSPPPRLVPLRPVRRWLPSPTGELWGGGGAASARSPRTWGEPLAYSRILAAGGAGGRRDPPRTRPPGRPRSLPRAPDLHQSPEGGASRSPLAPWAPEGSSREKPRSGPGWKSLSLAFAEGGLWLLRLLGGNSMWVPILNWKLN